jgi:hypothetical protein
VIGRKELDALKAYMIETMCMLDMCFPPVFDMQEHLMIHLVDHILTLGTLYLHSMFPYERYLAVLMAYVWTHAHPEGCIMEGYITEGVVECCVDYVKDGKWICLPTPLHEGRLRGRGRMGHKTFVDRNYNLVSEAHFSALHQVTIAGPYIDEHLLELRRYNIDRTDAWITKEHRRVFTTWLMDKDVPTEEMIMKMLASHPSSCVTSWQAYDINGYTYYTKEKHRRSVSQNSVIRIEAFDPLGVKITYYGYIQDIWELDYGARLQIHVFKCEWVKHPNGVSLDNYELTLVDLKNLGHKDNPWVLVDRVAQVFYVPDPETGKHLVVSRKQKTVGVENVEDNDEDVNQFEEMSRFSNPMNIKHIKKDFDKKLMPYMRKGGNGKSV